MYKYFLALGSNLGNKNKNIDLAIENIRNIPCKIVKIAPFYKTKPLLPNNADKNYNKTFLNTVIKICSNLNPSELLQKTQQIEINMGRKKDHKFWSPRIIDIDILYCQKNNKQIKISEQNLQIPHKEIFNRAFVLDPLSQIAPELIINNKNILSHSKKHKNHKASKMAIVNINNDSFSGDGITDNNELEKKIISLTKKRIAFIDIGAESTNPNSKQISYHEEINRLQKTDIFRIINQYKTNGVKFSIDTYHPETAKLAIENGFDLINDVNGFKNENMWIIMQNNPNIDAVIMHSIEPNGKKNNTIDKNADLVKILNEWVIEIEKKAIQYNIDKERIIVDYGIGFGKTAEQDLFIINNFEKINSRNFRVLIGHSRKSFLKLLGGNTLRERDALTKKLSYKLTRKGVDILRLHTIN